MIYGLILLVSSVLANNDRNDYCTILSSGENFNDHFCSFCSEGTSLSNRFCIPCREAIPGCGKCDCYSDTCFECQDGFYLTGNGDCQSCSTNVENCKTCNSMESGVNCEECNSPWLLHNGMCSKKEVKTQNRENKTDFDSRSQKENEFEDEWVQDASFMQEQHRDPRMKQETLSTDDSKAFWNLELSEPLDVDSWNNW